MSEYQDIVLIPKARIAVLIGEKGESKKQIEKSGKVKLNINSKSGAVLISAKDALTLWLTTSVVRAVARGFPPEIARKLFKQDYVYEQISLEDFAKNKKALIRLRGRIIGKEGTARDHLQTVTQTQIRVQGKTVMIIGEMEQVDLARRAITALLEGAPHSKVYEKIEYKLKEE